jgi:hypothetical protein
MNLQHRIHILSQLGKYILDDNEAWNATKQRASQANAWFTPEFIEYALWQISNSFLDEKKLVEWINKYDFNPNESHPRNVGIVMAGNIPLVGFHDFLCAFVAGHRMSIKLSSKDDVLLPFLVQKMQEWEPALKEKIQFAAMLKGADAYIATGSDNTARYFEYYFAKRPSIIRRNRSSIAVLKGDEDFSDLEMLADDVHLYFGLGCRNVTKIYVPEGYDFIPMLKAFEKYAYFSDHNKYRNNYDYNFALQIMNRGYYMTNGSLLLVESPQLFSPISQLNYEFFGNVSQRVVNEDADKLQCIVGRGFLSFGATQQPVLTDYADGIDTLQFLQELYR